MVVQLRRLEQPDDDDVWLDDAENRDGTRQRITTHVRRLDEFPIREFIINDRWMRIVRDGVRVTHNANVAVVVFDVHVEDWNSGVLSSQTRASVEKTVKFAGVSTVKSKR